MTAEANAKLHLREIDILYALGALLAILGHSHPNDWSLFPGKWIEFIYCFHMPLFFLIAGYLLAYTGGIKRLGYPKWLGQKALRLLTPYVVLTLAAFVPKYALENGGLGGISASALLTSFIKPRDGVWGHFWFLAVLFALYAIFGLLRVFDDWYGRSFKTVSAVLVLTAALHFLKIPSDIFCIKDVCEFAVYFAVGYYLSQYLSEKDFKIPNFARLIAVILLTAAGIVCFILSSGKPYSHYDLLVTVLMLAACWELGQLLKYATVPFADFIAHNVFTYYIYSWPAQAVVEKLCSRFAAPWYATMPAMFAVGVLCPTVIIFIYRKCAFLHRRPIELILGIRE